MNEEHLRGRGNKGIEINERDRQLFMAVFAHEGVLTFRQIVTLFFPGERYAADRLRKLVQYGWLNRSDAVLRAAYGEVCYWLTPKSAALVASMLDQPFNKQFSWVKRPHANHIPHEIMMNDVRIKVEMDCEQSGFLAVSEWVSEKEYKTHPDFVSFTNLDGKTAKRAVKPDGFCIIHNRTNGNNSRCLFELLHKVDNRRTILDEKILPGIAYLGSEAYKIRTGGFSSGRWFYVLHSPNAPLRLNNLKASIERQAASHADRFLLTTYEAAMEAANIVLDPIWHRAGSERLFSIIDPLKNAPQGD
jgi:hypothetical protein